MTNPEVKAKSFYAQQFSIVISMAENGLKYVHLKSQFWQVWLIGMRALKFLAVFGRQTCVILCMS